MKHWQETRQVLRRVAQMDTAEGHAAVATVIEISGSSYRGPGAKLFISSEGATCGGVSGGCLEADVRELARDVIRLGVARVRRYDTGSDEDTVWGLGLGCDGSVELFVQSVTALTNQTYARALELLESHEPFVACTLLNDTGSVLLAHGTLTSGTTGDPTLDRSIATEAAIVLSDGRSVKATVAGHEVFFDVLTPPPWLIIVGAGDDAQPLARMASIVGFRVAVVDHRPAFVTEKRFPDAQVLVAGRFDDPPGQLQLGPESYAVVMTHSVTHDRGWIERLSQTAIPYVGLLGPHKRVSNLLESIDQTAADRVYGPVGLDLGADGPEQIAVAVLAEVMAVRMGRQPQHLRNRGLPIHAG